MQEIKCNLQFFRVTKIDVYVDPFPDGQEFSLVCNGELNCREPVESDNLTGLLELKIDIQSDNKKDCRIRVSSTSIFSFDRKPTDFNKTMQDQCYPIARDRVYQFIKELTTNMGMAPLDLSKNE